MSNNGWSNDPLSMREIGVPGVKDTGAVRAGVVADVFQAFILDFHSTVEPLVTINGYRSAALNAESGGISTSNHRSATAVDLNGYKHPYEPSAPKPYNDGFTAAQTAQIRRLLAKYPVIKWGMDFNYGFRDAMHFEIRGTASDVTTVSNQIKTPVPPVVPTPLPAPAPIQPASQEEIMARLIKINEDQRIILVSDFLFQHIPTLDRANALAKVYGGWVNVSIQEAQRIHDQVNENITANAANLKGQGIS